MTKYGSFTDDAWAPLRDAMPSFAAHWSAFTSRSNYDPLYAGQNAIEFEFHLEEVLRADPESFRPLLVVMERLYLTADSSLRDLMTIKVLETLTKHAEEVGVDLRRIARMLPGPETRAAWREALAWTHPECTWDDERGLVPDWPPPVAVGRVRVETSRDLPETPTFAVDVELLDGLVRPGCFMWKSLSSCHHDGRAITAVEPLTSDSSSPTRLRILVAHYEREAPENRRYIAEGWYDSGEIVEIIERPPPGWR